MTLTFLVSACSNSSSDSDKSGYVYIPPKIDKKGRFRKGHVRAKVSVKKNAIKNQNRSRYYYRTRKRKR
jgi:hypothetical protein